MPFTGLMSDEVFQQSFMGLSIMDFTVNAGLNNGNLKRRQKPLSCESGICPIVKLRTKLALE